MIRIVLRLARLIGSVDILFARVSRHAKDGMRIERRLRGDRGLARATRFLLPLEYVRILSLTCLFRPLTRVLVLPKTSVLFLTRLLARELLHAIPLTLLFFFLRALLIGAFARGAPHIFGGIVPTRLAQVPQICNDTSADAALPPRAPDLQGQQYSANSGACDRETRTDPYA